jgi:hypothetical protein
LTAIANPYQAYNDLISQQIAEYSKPRGSDLDPMTMLAVAQGLLSPTRTGSFGESIGNAAGAAIGPLSKARSAEQDRMDKIAKLRETQVKLALEKQRLDDLNKRAAAGYDRDPSLVYGTSMTGLRGELEAYPDPDELIGLDQSTPEGKARADYLRTKRSEILSAMEAQRKRLMGGGAGDGTEPRGQRPAGQSAAPPAAGGPSGAPAAGATAAKAGQAGLIPTDEEIANAKQAPNGKFYIKRGNEYFEVVK